MRAVNFQGARLRHWTTADHHETFRRYHQENPRHMAESQKGLCLCRRVLSLKVRETVLKTNFGVGTKKKPLMQKKHTPVKQWTPPSPPVQCWISKRKPTLNRGGGGNPLFDDACINGFFFVPLEAKGGVIRSFLEKMHHFSRFALSIFSGSFELSAYVSLRT